MHTFIRAGERIKKETRIAIATDDITESRLKFQAEHVHLSTVSRYVDTLIQQRLNSQISKSGLPLTAQAKHILQDTAAAEADGKIDPIEKEEITDHWTDFLSDLRKRA